MAITWSLSLNNQTATSSLCLKNHTAILERRYTPPSLINSRLPNPRTQHSDDIFRQSTTNMLRPSTRNGISLPQYTNECKERFLHRAPLGNNRIHPTRNRNALANLAQFCAHVIQKHCSITLVVVDGMSKGSVEIAVTRFQQLCISLNQPLMTKRVSKCARGEKNRFLTAMHAKRPYLAAK